MSQKKSFLQRLPKVDVLLHDPELVRLGDALSHEVVVGLVRDAIAETRERFLAGDWDADQLAAAAIVGRVVTRAEQLLQPPLRKVINATGILIHTNLGRAPLSAAAQRGVAAVFGGYANLEMDLATGRRASRLGRVRELLQQVTGAEDALAVNNNAAAVYLALHVLAAGREVIVSRGELVEIGGSFRLPDIMATSGAVLREVGTTNRTRLSDYERAVGKRTGLILKVHPSNFVIQGFTEGVRTAELAELAQRSGIPLFEDLGSGALDQHPQEYLPDEPRVQATLRQGADMVSFSGDKLLGGPQAGVILGRGKMIGRLREHPLARVLRLDKVLLAALEATLLDYLRGSQGVHGIPLYRMMQREPGDLRRLAGELSERLREAVDAEWRLEVVATEAAAGGGSLPGKTLASAGLEIWREGMVVDRLAHHLRAGRPAIVGRIERDRLILDLRTVTEEDWSLLPELLAERLNEYAADTGAQGG